MLSNCKDLDTYFSRYGELLGERASKALAPLHVPGRDPDVPGVDAVNDHVKLARRSVLFGAQRDVLSGTVKSLRRQKSIFLACECGTGKSLLGSAAAQVARFVKEGSGTRPYRGMIMCPDHLIKKWLREVELTCPGAKARSFTDWREVLAACESQSRPPGPEWWVIGRDQSKGDPAWETRVVRKRILVGEKSDRAPLRKKGVTLLELATEVAACPKCGTVVTDKDDNPVAYKAVLASKKKLKCKGTVSTYRTEGDDCIEDLANCKEPLWTFIASKTKTERADRKAKRSGQGLETGTAPYRWPAYRSVKGRMNRKLDYLILDEVHELKAEDTGQANAAGAFISRARKVIALTGTLIGGYADHLFPLLMRLAPQSLVAAGFAWDDFAAFNARYGRIETVIHTRSEKPEEGTSNSHTKGGSGNRITKHRRPGVMPQLYGDHLIGKCCFLSLDQVAEGLPGLTETIIPVDMDPDQAEAYEELEDWLRATIKSMLVKGNRRLLAAMLESLLYFPDHPFGWDTIGTDEEGYFQPATLDESVVRPKEETLVALCAAQAAQGRQTWVYVQRTGTRDVGGRLVRLLGDAGLRAGMLRSSVSPREREEWIYKKGRTLDVCVSHPDLVKTGLDLFSNDCGVNHNYATLVFYQTGYNTFTLRQASRRSWRVGQKQPCKTAFIYYSGTMQERCMTHMGKKMAACEALDGKFSSEGLAAMAGDDDAIMALARSLVDKVTLPAGSGWSKTLGFDQPAADTVPVPTPAAPTRTGVSFTAEELDTLRRLHARLKGA